jgi:hypothetical protein
VSAARESAAPKNELEAVIDLAAARSLLYRASSSPALASCQWLARSPDHPGDYQRLIEVGSGGSSALARLANTASNIAIVSFLVFVLYREQ